jgi:nitrous oxidase accessory protein
VARRTTPHAGKSRVTSLLLIAILGAVPLGASAPQFEKQPQTVSPLQQLVDQASPGDEIVVPAGRYLGHLVIDRSVTMRGEGRPTLVATDDDSIVTIVAPGVVFEGFDLDGLEHGDLGNDSSGVLINAHDVTVRDCQMWRTLFGVYLKEANGAVVEHNRIEGIEEKEAGEKGSGIHIWNTVGFTVTDNELITVRDGFYIQSSSNGRIANNEARDLRYGIHYMYSDDNVFEDNLFEGGAAGGALMFSRRLTFRRNRFLHNRGFASVGLLFKECDDIIAEDNLLANNARGIFLEGSYRNVFRRNIIAQSDVALVIYDSVSGNRFEENSFVANLSPLQLVGRRTDTVFEGNYWSGNDQVDLDGDGHTELPYRLSDVFDYFRGQLKAADLFVHGFAAPALAAAERVFPVLDPIPVEDPTPLAQPPVLVEVPKPRLEAGGPDAAGLAASLLLLIVGGAAIASGRRRRTPPASASVKVPA